MAYICLILCSSHNNNEQQNLQLWFVTHLLQTCKYTGSLFHVVYDRKVYKRKRYTKLKREKIKRFFLPPRAEKGLNSKYACKIPTSHAMLECTFTYTTVCPVL